MTTRMAWCNTARGDARFDMSMRLGKTFGFGGARSGGNGQGGRQGGRQGGGGLTSPQAGFGGGGRGPGGGGGGFLGDGTNQRFTVELYAQGNNVLNRTNFLSYSGNQLSPFYTQPTAAAQARRVEVGLQFRF